jgi:hypothetical protein
MVAWRTRQYSFMSIIMPASLDPPTEQRIRSDTSAIGVAAAVALAGDITATEGVEIRHGGWGNLTGALS